MRVNEIFYSIQGEGKSMGKPAVFVRLSGCNLRCWFCDTKYAFNEYKDMSISEVIREIESFNCDRVVWTGGEPALQINDVLKVVNLLQLYKHEIETNGTIYFPTKYFDVVTVSPKRNNVNLDVLEKMKNSDNVYFKFVINDKKDLMYYVGLMNELELDRDRVYFQPQATSIDEIVEKGKWLVEECKKYNVNFSARLHIILYGNVRGR